MKKIIISLLIIITSISATAQVVTDTVLLKKGRYRIDTLHYLSNTPLFYFNAYGNFVSLRDSVRSFFSATSPLSYNSATGGFALGVVPIANGGTNNGSLSVTSGTIYYGDGTKLIGLAPGTAAQHLTGGTTPSWKDTATGGGGTPAGSDTYVQYNNSGAFGADSAFRWKSTGFASTLRKNIGLYVRPLLTAQANSDTSVALSINTNFTANGKTGTKYYDMQIGKVYIRMDSLYNIGMGTGEQAAPTTNGGALFIGQNAGGTATGAYRSFFRGVNAGSAATNAFESFFNGTNAGLNASAANNSNFIGGGAGLNATNAAVSNFIGNNAGSGATNATFSNFSGQNAGASATGASYSNFSGWFSGSGATSATFSIFSGYESGLGATGASNSVLLGNQAGENATGASYSTFIGYHVGDSAGSLTSHKVVGSNNIIIGTNITTPFRTAANTMNLGGVLYGSNLYATLSGSPLIGATFGKIGINNSNPSAILQIGAGDTAVGQAPLKLTYTSIATTAASGTGAVVTITFAAQTVPPFAIGSSIVIAGVTPAGYNGTYTVTSCTTSTVTFNSVTTGAQTVAGTIVQGRLLTTPEDGVIERDSSALYFSAGSGTNLQRNKLIKGVSGTATLVGGTVTVNTTYVKATSRILVSVDTPGGTQGFLSAPVASITAGASFVINSSNILDTSTVYWLIINP